MSIKVTLGEAKTQQEKPFPKLMVSVSGTFNGSIAFFICNREAVVLSNPHGYPPGYAPNFNMEDWVDYNEPITLQND